MNVNMEHISAVTRAIIQREVTDVLVPMALDCQKTSRRAMTLTSVLTTKAFVEAWSAGIRMEVTSVSAEMTRKWMNKANVTHQIYASTTTVDALSRFHYDSFVLLPMILLSFSAQFL